MAPDHKLDIAYVPNRRKQIEVIREGLAHSQLSKNSPEAGYLQYIESTTMQPETEWSNYRSVLIWQ